MRKKLNLTIHPEVRAFAEAMAEKKRRSISQLFEELVEAEWLRQNPSLRESPTNYNATPPRKTPATPPPVIPLSPDWETHISDDAGNGQN